MLDKALVREIGNIKNKDNLLLKALLCMVTYSLQKKGSVSYVKTTKKRKSPREYTMQDAFNDAFKGRGSNKFPQYSSLANKLIPKPM